MEIENTYGKFPEEMNLAEAERYSANGVEGIWKNMACFLGNVMISRNRLTDAFYQKRYQDYAVSVHGMKSSLALLGAMNLSAKAKELELAAKEERIDFVEQNHEAFLAQYDDFVEKLEQCFEKRNDTKTVEKSVTEIAEELIEAADHFDVVGIGEQAEKLAKTEDTTPKQREIIAEILKAVEDLDFASVKAAAEKLRLESER